MILALAALVVLLSALHLASLLLVWRRLARPVPVVAAEAVPPTTLLRPVCGIDHALRDTLGSSFLLQAEQYEVIFCAARPDDPAIPVAQALIDAHPGTAARLLVGDDRIGGNPKLNNLVKGLDAARFPWVVMADSNLFLPPDYLRQIAAAWTDDTGMVSSPAIGTDAQGLAAGIECAFLNSLQARWQLAADEVGLGFAQGKTMAWRRDILEAGGGLRALAQEMAEDVAATRLVRRQGLKVRIAQRAFAQPIGRRRIGPVWSRQVRWARVRRLGFPGLYAAEILSGGLVPVLAVAGLAALGALPGAMAAAFVVIWYGVEYLTARRAGWSDGPSVVGHMIVRDLLVAPLWLAGWAGSGFTWRGNAMTTAEVVPARAPEP